MKLMNDRKLAFPVLAFCLFIGPASGHAGSAGIEVGQPISPRVLDSIPADWAGLWQYETDIKDCDSGITVFHMSRLDSLCVGDTFDPEQDGTITNLVCNGTITGSEIHYVCTGSAQEEPGCFADYEIVYDAVRTGDSVQATETFNTTYSGDCPVSDQCVRMEMSGTRLAGTAPGCQLTPSQQSSWGALKGTYR